MNMQDSKATNEAQIRALVDRRVEALHAKDAPAVLSCLTPDFVGFSLAPPLVSIMTNTRAYEAWFATWKGPIGTEIRDLAIAVSGDLGVSHSLNLMTGIAAGGHEVKLWYQPDAELPQDQRSLEDRARAQFGAVLHGRRLPRRNRSETLTSDIPDCSSRRKPCR